MKPQPIHLIVSRLKRMHLHDRIFELRKLVAIEKPFSVRRGELQSLLDGAVQRQIKVELRKAKAA